MNRYYNHLDCLSLRVKRERVLKHLDEKSLIKKLQLSQKLTNKKRYYFEKLLGEELKNFGMYVNKYCYKHTTIKETIEVISYFEYLQEIFNHQIKLLKEKQ